LVDSFYVCIDHVAQFYNILQSLVKKMKYTRGFSCLSIRR